MQDFNLEVQFFYNLTNLLELLNRNIKTNIMKQKTFTIYCLLISLLFTACVSQNRFNRVSEKIAQSESDKVVAEDKLKTCVAEREKLLNQNTSFSTDNEKLRRDTTERGDYQRKMQRNYAVLNESYDKLIKNQDRIQGFSNEELSKREKDLFASEKRINELNADLKAREQKVKTLETILASKDAAVTELKRKVSEALLSFKEKDLTIEVRNGKVYVSLSEQLLFKSGSIEVDAKGLDPLRKLASALKDQQDISINVEGHTDDVKIAKGSAGVKDNWDLSVLRATSITKILTEAGVNPIQITPSGRGEYLPVADGKTPEARQKNRRTEIILTPKLDELFKILENK